MYIIEKRHRLQGCNLYIPRDLNCLSRYDPPLSYRRSKRTLGISWDCSLFFLSWPEEGLYIERHSEFRGFCVIILFLFFFARVVGYSSIGCNRILRGRGAYWMLYTNLTDADAFMAFPYILREAVHRKGVYRRCKNVSNHRQCCLFRAGVQNLIGYSIETAISKDANMCCLANKYNKENKRGWWIKASVGFDNISHRT